MLDVVIAGGGPAGLFLATELQLAGATPLVLERAAEPDRTDKAHGIAGQAVRLLDHRGLYERCGGRGTPEPAPGFFFAGMPLPLHLLGPANPLHLLPVNQRDLERVLFERALELGVEVRRGWEVLSFRPDSDRVDVVVRDPDGAESTLSAQFLVGCDGGNSLVRKGSGIGFPGRTEEVVDRSAIVGAGANLKPAPGGRVVVEGLGEIPGVFHRTATGVFSVLPHDPNRPLVNTAEWEEHPPEGPMTLAEMEDSVERVLGVRVPLTPPPENGPHLLRRLTHRNSRQADHYREGRVFIAGDAAHVSHGPTLNLALQDAANLAWKLAAAIAGRAPEGLLDTYERERHASGARVVLHTQVETALTAPGPDVTALRQVFGEFLGQPAVLAMVAGAMAGADVRYDMGDPDPGELTGWFVPAIDVVVDGTPVRIAELLRDARPLLLDRAGDESPAVVAKPWDGWVRRVAARADEGPSMLIRPDGYVAWSGADALGLEAALTRWFGPGTP